MVVGAKASVQSNPRFEVRDVTVLPCHEVRVRGRLVLPLSGLSAGEFILLAESIIRDAKIAAREENRIVRRTMLQQEAMIERVRRVYQEDERLTATMMYGSFVQGEGAGLSDIAFILFFEDDALKDQEERVSPDELYFVNEYGNGTVIFDNLVWGEFHFDTPRGSQGSPSHGKTPTGYLPLRTSSSTWSVCWRDRPKAGATPRSSSKRTSPTMPTPGKRPVRPA
jgi:predicted nucleotidyltransferase